MSGDRPKVDPWEAREKQRERWNRPRGSSRRSTPEPEAGNNDLRENYLPLGMVASVAILLLSEIPSFAGETRTFLSLAGAALLLLLLATARSFADDMRVSLRRGPNPFLILLLVWSGYCLFLAPYRSYAATEMMRVLAGAGAYFLAAYTLKTPRQMSWVITGLLGMGIALALYDFSQLGQANQAFTTHFSNETSIFGTHENVGSLMVLLVPIGLSFAISGEIEEKRRLVSLAATLVLGGALLVARTRSAWIGGLFALAALAFLFVRFLPAPAAAKTEKSARQRLQALLASPVVFVALGFTLFIAVGGIAPYLSDRAQTLIGVLDDSSLKGRLHSWDGAMRMASEKPVTGWGLGSFTVMQGLWTHRGDDIPQVLTVGTGHYNIAHNYYVQWASEAGGVGLALYVAVLAAFLIAAFRGARRATRPFHRILLCGCTATVVGGVVDALASPAYNFHGVSTVFWVWMGLGVAALRPAPRRAGDPDPGPALVPAPWGWTAAAGFAGVLAACTVIGLGFQHRAQGTRVQRGILQIRATPSGAISPGTTLVWTAIYTDENGAEQPTMPGTIWEFRGDTAAVSRGKQAGLIDVPATDTTARRSALRVQLPPTSAPVTMKAAYRDGYGRPYEAWSTITVKPASP